MKERIRANNKYLWILIYSLALIGMGLIISDTITTNCVQEIVFFVVFIYVTVCFLFQLTHTTYLCAAGVELYFLGKLQRITNWNNVCQICTMKLFPLSMKVSAPTYILIVPAGCEPYNQEKWLGLKYWIRFRHCVYRIDDSPRNRKLINQLYGELDIQC